MDVLKDILHTFGGDTEQRTLCTALVENLGVALGLHDGHALLLLVFTHLARDAHTAGEQLDEVVVHLVNLLTQ